MHEPRRIRFRRGFSHFYWRRFFPETYRRRRGSISPALAHLPRRWTVAAGLLAFSGERFMWAILQVLRPLWLWALLVGVWALAWFVQVVLPADLPATIREPSNHSGTL